MCTSACVLLNRQTRENLYICVALPNFVIPHVLCSSEYFFVSQQKNNDEQDLEPQAKKKGRRFFIQQTENDDEFLSAKFIYHRKTSL